MTVIPFPSQTWSYDELSKLREMGRKGQGLLLMARATGHTRAEVDRALWVLIGRSIGQAADVLNMPILCSQRAGGVKSAPRVAP